MNQQLTEQNMQSSTEDTVQKNHQRTEKANKPSKNLQAIKGMNDILPKDMPYWNLFESLAIKTLHQFGFKQIRMPLLEQTEVFVRGIGEVTDIVEKEMYSFTDQLNGEHLTLRPEGTASCVRAVNEHHLLYDAPKKLWYMGPMFRHERPQRGRYRQFHQLGLESLGYKNSLADFELIQLSYELFKQLNIAQYVQLNLNSLGDIAHRQAHKQALLAYFNEHIEVLDEDSKRRLHSNPLRILDSKNPAMQAMIEQAPVLMNYIDGEAKAHFDELLALLNQFNIPYTLNHRLVRGLDYYNRSVFEWITQELGAQGTVCGGGRYDPLIAMMGGKDAPAVGLAMGIERLLELIKLSHTLEEETQCYLIYNCTEKDVQNYAIKVATHLRASGLQVVLHIDSNEPQSFKAQFKRANQLNTKFAIIVGQEEVLAQTIQIKCLKNQENAQSAPNMPNALNTQQTFTCNTNLSTEDFKATHQDLLAFLNAF